MKVGDRIISDSSSCNNLKLPDRDIMYVSPSITTYPTEKSDITLDGRAALLLVVLNPANGSEMLGKGPGSVIVESNLL